MFFIFGRFQLLFTENSNKVDIYILSINSYILNALFCLLLFQLQAKFEAIKKQHAEERKKIEEKRRILQEEMAAFERRKQLAEQAKSGGAASATMKKKK